MGWLDKQDPVLEKKRGFLRAMILREIDAMTEDQLALAAVIARKARLGDPRVLAALEPEDG